MTKQSTANQLVLTTINNSVATVTLNNPAKHNAFDDEIIALLTSTFNALASNPDIRAMVLTGNGKSFSAGGDLAWMKRMAGYSYDENLADAQGLALMLKTLNTLPFPTIAKVAGTAFGGAVGLISCCDIAIGASHAKFSLSEVKIGLLPATISPYVIAAIGQRAARRYFLTAERFDASTAQQLGLLSECVELDQLDNKVEAIISAIVSNSPAAIKASKQLIFKVADKVIDQKLIDYTCDQIATIRASNEGKEGLQAFLDKRPANWLKTDGHS
jgi:methylglutaconyl-CoA hydratase